MRTRVSAGASSRRSNAVGLALVAVALAVLASCSSKEEATTPNTTGTTAPPETTTTTEVPLAAGRQIFVWTPEPGECFDKRKPDPKKPDEVVLKLDCNLPHSNEIFGTIDLPVKDHPGDPFMKELGMKECPKQFKVYVGAPYETSRWEMGYYFPPASSWGQSNKHVIGCYLYDPGKKLEGSKKASAQ